MSKLNKLFKHKNDEEWDEAARRIAPPPLFPYLYIKYFEILLDIQSRHKKEL